MSNRLFGIVSSARSDFRQEMDVLEKQAFRRRFESLCRAPDAEITVTSVDAITVEHAIELFASDDGEPTEFATESEPAPAATFDGPTTPEPDPVATFEVATHSEPAPVAPLEVATNSEPAPVATLEVATNSEPAPVATLEVATNSEPAPVATLEVATNSEPAP